MPVAIPSAFVVIGAVAVAWLSGRLVRAIGQPAVIGELLAGIALGPSLLGAVAPDFSARLFTPNTVSTISLIAKVAVLVFLFLVGLELDTSILRKHARGVLRIAVSSFVPPFIMGSGLALWLYPSWHGAVPNQTAFVLFVGTAMSITALPVLTRILADWRMLQTTIGTIAMGCAAIDDIVAWTLLGVVAGLVRGDAAGPGMALLVCGYLAVMAFVVRPLLERAVAFRSKSSSGRAIWLLVVAAVAFGSIEAAEWIGIHGVFGAFLAGACVPRRADVLEGLESPLRRVSMFLMPAFFVLIGLKTALRLLTGADAWIVTAAILGCAVVGKIGGSSVAARTLGFSWRDSFAIGALLDTRGLVGLVVLDIGRGLGILSPALFTMFVIMTFVTTFATVPLMRAIGLRPGDRR